MSTTLAWTALLMGLVGGPHCLAMCSAPCAALTGGARVPAPLPGVPVARGHAAWRSVAFHAGRLAGYAAAGALAALAMDSLAWLTRQSAALRPAWTLVHVAVMAWGLLLLLQSRQPAWVEQAGRAVWARVQPLVRAPGGVLVAGVLWALLPCGLLYSALLVAALSGTLLQGALSMALFGVGSGLWLVAGPWIWGRLRNRLDAARTEWGSRVAGALLCAVAAWALWVDLLHAPALGCR
ncbi:sulfite exporter TauE/SafE family protein [Verminephrobacter aporrectodeae subsp. tuberculatae]|uniref:sulfite exporter TauE/SafE family protein n=2 Tax=Verminephrobacter aporrectodeae TaxID=1110389 RepID=UPI00223788F7|nr:sulfite exporter TauE/SafE family protein [Verminephrobacter aporrectodeae]MCW5222309.1 sulfite exporter TauE/SafE family protein [Verminephrobacter aporrectodeae subsp. tuberculatae]MCW5287773.1 sulfite exporter TauE/SafE family protein [Verminephrobacter aporrectodeae subsp. tuberculatae]